MIDLWAIDKDGKQIFSQHHYKKRGWLPAGTVDFDYAVWRPDLQEPTVADCLINDIRAEIDVPNKEDAVNWWLFEHCRGRWDKIHKTKIEFELATDAVYFKMIWT